ncbi:MAG: heme-binding protein [Planctomycetes bacterium]|nr:heme-binding protein [Planctomycetota bacterium]
MLSITRLSIDDAKCLADGARAKAIEIGVPMCIAIVDESGNPILFERMDGGKVTSAIIAQDKAYTAGGARKATHEYNEVCKPGSLVFGIHTAIGGRLCVVGGGLPVVVGSECVGGIGLSSGTPQQDMQCAQAGIDHFHSSLVVS